MTTRLLAILDGTLDIHAPLQARLGRALGEPVRRVKNVRALARLLHEAAGSKVWIIPGNEDALWSLATFLEQLPRTMAAAVGVPGTGQRGDGTVVAPWVLADKAQLGQLVDRPWSAFRVAEIEAVSPGCETLKTPFGDEEDLVVKPARHAKGDTFRARVPRKLVSARGGRHALAVARRLEAAFSGYRFVVQRRVRGTPISWYGALFDGRAIGYEIRSLWRTPEGNADGTAVLAVRSEASSRLRSAVTELGAALRLDGIFEVEFVDTGSDLVFIHDLNPRPCLQATLGFGLPDVHVEYLASKGFTRRGEVADSQPIWGSAWRYVAGLSQWTALDLPLLTRMLVADPVFRHGGLVANARQLFRVGSSACRLLTRSSWGADGPAAPRAA